MSLLACVQENFSYKANFPGYYQFYKLPFGQSQMESYFVQKISYCYSLRLAPQPYVIINIFCATTLRDSLFPALILCVQNGDVVVIIFLFLILNLRTYIIFFLPKFQTRFLYCFGCPENILNSINSRRLQQDINNPQIFIILGYQFYHLIYLYTLVEAFLIGI